MRRLMLIAVVLTGVVVVQSLVTSRDFMLYAMHRWYHWRSGRGWRCETCIAARRQFHPPRAPHIPTKPLN